MASRQEIVITKNGQPVARLLGLKKTVAFLSDRLAGLVPPTLVPPTVDEGEAKSARLARR